MYVQGEGPGGERVEREILGKNKDGSGVTDQVGWTRRGKAEAKNEGRRIQGGPGVRVRDERGYGGWEQG